jgi:hypothetical protein
VTQYLFFNDRRAILPHYHPAAGPPGDGMAMFRTLIEVSGITPF